VPQDRIAVIPNGINEAHFVTALTPDAAKAHLGLQGALVLDFTGFVRDWPGVGDGPVRAELEALAATLGIAQRMRFTGVIDRHRVLEHVAAFDIALQPAVTAYASQLKLMEYLVLGKAIIAPREPNLLEVLSDGDNALLFDDKLPGSFEAALTRLCADPALRRQLDDGARRTITRLDLTWQGNARRVVKLVAQLRNP
jgi:glycosyltransferase involved in cell wall biosynthesis